MAIPRFHVRSAAVRDGELRLEDPREVHHALHVLRLTPNDRCIVCDGTGTEYQGRIRRATRQGLLLAIERVVQAPAALLPRITLVQALPKWPAFETILRHATELGVARILPVMTTRSQVRITESAWSQKRARWTRILHEAAKQCQRAVIPELVTPQRWQTYVMSECTHGFHCLLTLALPAPPLVTVLQPPLPDALTVCIGPEGDLTAEEARTFIQHGGRIASLGPRILRTETAALATLAILQHEWSRQQMTG